MEKMVERGFKEPPDWRRRATIALGPASEDRARTDSTARNGGGTTPFRRGFYRVFENLNLVRLLRRRLVGARILT